MKRANKVAVLCVILFIIGFSMQFNLMIHEIKEREKNTYPISYERASFNVVICGYVGIILMIYTWFAAAIQTYIDSTENYKNKLR